MLELILLCKKKTVDKSLNEFKMKLFCRSTNVRQTGYYFPTFSPLLKNEGRKKGSYTLN